MLPEVSELPKQDCDAKGDVRKQNAANEVSTEVF